MPDSFESRAKKSTRLPRARGNVARRKKYTDAGNPKKTLPKALLFFRVPQKRWKLR